MNEFIKPYFEKNNIKCCLSEYYIKIVKDMIGQLLNSKPGRRLWNEIEQNNQWWFNDYRVTERSTFPDWSKFFFEKSIYSKKEINWITSITDDWRYLIEKWYNWSSREFINILNKSFEKWLTERQWNAMEDAFSNFIDYVNQHEKFWKEDYFQKKDYFIIIYDSEWRIIWIEEKNMI